ncbi:hypothetical protein HF086_008888 [Spodoptera exigua]|uniref:Ig-like domain-containing protein n=1 Tax=Spodoptera exigua TaxID=7107 RepID=A0A922MQ38_SPOEX|nr:hypothetical protein HF086_008888 [Spodoptera exigua]
MFVKSGILKGNIQEGDTVVIGCQANANPNNLTYKWYVNNEHIVGDVSNELKLSNISRRFNEATIKCEVHNQVGKSADTKTLEVACKCRLKNYNTSSLKLRFDELTVLGTGVNT